MTRQWYIHQDSYIYIKIRLYTSRFVYIHQDSYIYVKIRIYTSRFVYIHQDSKIYSKIRIYTSRFVDIQQDSYIYIKICIYTLRFVQFGHKGKHDRWIDYRVFKRRSKRAANEEADFSLLRRVYRAMTEEMTPASNVEEELLRVFPFFFPVLVHSSLLCAIHEWIMEVMAVVERKGD